MSELESYKVLKELKIVNDDRCTLHVEHMARTGEDFLHITPWEEDGHFSEIALNKEESLKLADWIISRYRTK